MAGSKFRSLLIALVLLPAACDFRHDDEAQGSITVQLPPARKATPRPGFSLDAPLKAASPADEHVAAAVRSLVKVSR